MHRCGIQLPRDDAGCADLRLRRARVMLESMRDHTELRHDKDRSEQEIRQ